ncbi:SusC/RagA family TonB-linked outer membrane protein [Butyricimonas paravirosa]|uniref:SusC/RagA family TonB-linked outer membrane protein n=1 Tax=Butyricimonas paravirosa TaxID=1472417 RepID=UPI0026E00EC8|nr:SusC/RagA family TonB-linked outer membrane protein [Butyricimonas paravirosa]
MKKRTRNRHVRSVFLRKILLLGFLLFSFSLSYAAREDSTKLVSFSVKSESLKNALVTFKDLTGVQILFNEELLGDTPCKDLNLVNVSLDVALGKILEGSGFVYSKVDGVYIVKKAPKKKEPQVTQRVLTGEVVDAAGLPLPGVTVIVKGTTFGGATDMDGKFELSLTLEGEITLVFSFVGMESQEIVVKDEKPLRVVLKESSESLEEVVVTGVFERRAESFTGSATTVTRKELLKRGNQNLIQSLRNLDPALNISQNLSFGSDPNKLPDMELRGTSSFPDIKGQYTSNPNLPLFILDGFETTLEKVIDLDINRVQSVTLLKDAAAKAIYGSKAANGVMVIETVRVQSGELRVNYIGSLNLEMPDLSSYNLCNAREKLDLEWQLKAYDGGGPIQDFDKKQLYYHNLEEVEKGVNTDWLSQPLRNGVGHKHTLNFEVGNNELRVGVDLSYNNIEGVMKGSKRNTIGGGFTVIYQYKKLLFRNQFSFSSTKSEDSPYGEFSEYAKLNPYWRIYNEDGSLRKYLGVGPVFSNPVYNPMFNATINTTFKKDYTDYTNNTYLEYNIKPGMKLVGRVGLTSRINGAEEFLPGSHLKFIDSAEDDFFKRGSYKQTNGKSFSISSDLNLNYSHNWDKHILFANLGVNIRSDESEEYIHEAVGFPNDKMDNIIFAKQYADNAKPSGSESINREVGALLAVNYSYDDRYLADFSLRVSASSQFGSDNRWGTFWSAGLGWNVHNEAFFKESGVVKQLRLRASMGYTGSQNFNSYQGMLLYNYFSDDSYMDFIGTYLEGLANSKLKWQQKFDVNYGIDMNLWGRLNVKFDYYRSTTDNLLTDITTPPSLGFNSYKDNMGKLLNTGYEFNLNYLLLSRPEDRMSLNVFVAGTSNKNEIKKISNSLKALTSEQDKLAATSNKPFVRFAEGQSMNAIWAVRSKGIDPSSGKEVFVRPNGTLTDTWSALDQVVCGDTEADLTGNVGFAFEYKGLSVSFTGLYRFGGYIYNQTLVDKVENAQLNYNVDKRAYYNAWLKEGDHVQFKSIGAWNKPTQATSRFVQKLNEFDFSALSIGYDFYRFGFVEKCGLERLQLQFNMNDIGKISSVQIERGTSYPFARYCSFTLNVNF